MENTGVQKGWVVLEVLSKHQAGYAFFNNLLQYLTVIASV